MSALALRSCYCTAFCRFVTGLLDSMQESHYKVSMYDKARELKLPASFVELRHEAIHGETPSLIVLRQAIQKALDWLQISYWRQLNDEGNRADYKLSSSGENITLPREHTKNLLQKYPGTLFVPASPKQDRDVDGESHAMSKIISKILEDSNEGQEASAKFIDILYDRWMLYSSSEDLTATVVMPNTYCDNSRLDQSTYIMDVHWNPLLKTLARNRPFPVRRLSDVMIKRLTVQSAMAPSKERYQTLLSTWLNRIYTAPEWHKAFDESGLNAVETVSQCLQSPNRWTMSLAASISECPKHIQAKKVFGNRISFTLKSWEEYSGGVTKIGLES
ncbi:MAG: hypothetical protein Q9213_004321 [Squamulea squamosa]